MEWLLLLGIGLLLGGIVLTVWEEWPSRGLTDTSYKCLIIWIVGCVILQAWSHYTVQLVNTMVLGVILDVPILVFAYWISLKVVDHAKTYWLPSLRRFKP